MVRPKQFDREEVLERAMNVFWNKGFEAASVQDLLDEMGINRGSLYDTFGDKQELFLESLEFYQQRVLSEMLGILKQGDSGRDAIHEFFKTLVDRIQRGEGKNGCLVGNSLVETAPHWEEASKAVEKCVQEIEQTFYDALMRANEKGEISSKQSSRSLARYLTTLAMGINIVGKSPRGGQLAREAAKTGLSVLDC